MQLKEIDNYLAKKNIRNPPKSTQYLFRSNLVGAHYSKKAAQFLNERNSKFVPRSENPPNTPEIRFSDYFWALIKGEVYKDGWEAENLDQLRIRIFSCFKRADRVDAYRI